VLFIENLGYRVYSARYNFAIDGYEVEEVGILADHIGRQSSIKQIIYQPGNKILWVRRTDGTIATCTYIRNQEVAGWARHPIGGTDPVCESLSVIIGSTYTEVWAEFSRTVNGSTVRYVEVLANEFMYGSKEDAQYLDCMVTYDSTPVSTISGLSHLEGETVTILADGATHPTRVVSSGSITLNQNYSTVQIGYNYDSILETPSLEGGSALGAAQSQIARITEVGLKLFESLGMKFGFDENQLDTLVFRKASDLMGNSPALFSGFKTFKFNKGYDREYKVYIKQDQPLPLTVLQLVIKAGVSDAQ